MVVEKACLGLVPVGQIERPRGHGARFLKQHKASALEQLEDDGK